jgi:serine/threonine protein kinase
MVFEVYGNYTLLEKLAMGGMAEVFLAKKMGVTGVEKYVAIKRILPQHSQQEEFIEMFRHEASIAINLSHSNIVSIFDFGLEEKQFYIVMDFCSGRNLRQVLNHIRKTETQLSFEHAIFIVREIAAGLDYAHRAMDNKTGRPLNIIHRDISPQNVMISFEGEVKIVDFGIAKAETQTENTQAGTLKGKFGYMSPEQVEGAALDLRTDVFSLGILLWELLANDRLFMANNEQATIRKIKECKIPPLRQLNPSIPAELERIVNKALTKDRNLRYQAAAALQKDLTVFLNKHFPMFTNQDFSGFIKKEFNAEILENRKKQMEYSSVKFTQKLAEQAAARPEQTLSETVQTDGQKGPTPEYDDDVTVNTSDSFNIGDLGFVKRAQQKPAAEFNENARVHKPHPTLSSTSKKVQAELSPARLEIDQSSFHRSTKSMRTGSYHTEASFHLSRQKKQMNPAIKLYAGAALVFAIICFGVYRLKQSGASEKYVTSFARCLATPANCADAPHEQIDQASQLPETVTVYITSNPPNAHILVNNETPSDGAKTTPDNIKILANKPVKITLQLDGYNRWEKTVSGETSETVSADLSRKRSAFIVANVKGNGDIYINRKHFGHCTAIAPCVVEPDEDLLVEVYDAYTKAFDKLTVKLSDGETKQITLIPSLKRDATPRRITN